MIISRYTDYSLKPEPRAPLSIIYIMAFDMGVCTRPNSDTRQTMKPTPSRAVASITKLADKQAQLAC